SGLFTSYCIVLVLSACKTGFAPCVSTPLCAVTVQHQRSPFPRRIKGRFALATHRLLLSSPSGPVPSLSRRTFSVPDSYLCILSELGSIGHTTQDAKN